MSARADGSQGRMTKQAGFWHSDARHLVERRHGAIVFYRQFFDQSRRCPTGADA